MTASDLREALVHLADLAASAVCEPNRFARNDDGLQQSLGGAVASARAIVALFQDGDSPNHSPAETREEHGGDGEVDASEPSRGAEPFELTRRPGLRALREAVRTMPSDHAADYLATLDGLIAARASRRSLPGAPSPDVLVGGETAE